MKPLLIHNNNTYLLKTFQKQGWLTEKFESDNKSDIDWQIDGFIQTNIAPHLPSAVFIKGSLTRNYLEYLGFRVGLHLRVSSRYPSLQTLPIVFLCEERAEEIARIYKYAEIIFSDGVYVSSEAPEQISSCFEHLLTGKLSACVSLDQLMERLTIHPPADYLSHHSITNEWSILRWAEVLGISPQERALAKIRSNAECLLYYKYLKMKYPVGASASIDVGRVVGRGKVLYIDDEWNKGWNEVLKRLFSEPAHTQFRTWRNDFRDKDGKKIIEESLDEITSFDPDVILLDLRLCEADFSNFSTKQLTGFRILQEIKGYYDDRGNFVEGLNPGIQVIVFTASNKVWNLTELQRAGADCFVLKESPELSIDKTYSTSALEKLVLSLTDTLRMSFLKKIHERIKIIKGHAKTKFHDVDIEFERRLYNNLEIAFKLLKETRSSSKYYNYAYLQIFQIVEDYSNLDAIFSEGEDSYVVVEDRRVCVQKSLNRKVEYPITLTSNGKYEIRKSEVHLQGSDRPKRLDINFKVSAILIYRFGNPNSSVHKWTNLYTIRNSKAAHFNKEDSITPEQICMLLDFIIYFVCTATQVDTNVDQGLQEKSMDESLAVLKSRFQKK
jgi:CheY-like chemotaxis protein